MNVKKSKWRKSCQYKEDKNAKRTAFPFSFLMEARGDVRISEQRQQQKKF